MVVLIYLFCYLKRVVYLYKYIDNKGKFGETSLPSTENFCHNLNFQNITKSYYKHAKNVSNTFKMKNLGDYHELCVQKDTRCVLMPMVLILLISIQNLHHNGLKH